MARKEVADRIAAVPMQRTVGPWIGLVPQGTVLVARTG
jgi:hypothetical protein